jgi:23S rRNA (uracil1939-C5)-methyltransferase
MVFPPLKLEIDRLGPKGDGIARSPRGSVYLERTAPGDQVKAKIYKDSEGVLRGDVVAVTHPSPYRQTPPCPHYEKCGNCTLQHLNTEFYRFWKTNMVKEAFLKVGLKPLKWLKPIFVEGHNRRRLTFTVVKKKGKVVMGYYQRRSKEVTDIESCEIADPKLLELKKTLKPFLNRLVKEGQTADLFFQLIDESIDMVISDPFGKLGKIDSTTLNILEDLCDVTSISRVSFKVDDKFQTLIKKQTVHKPFGKLKVELPPAAFLQPTSEGEEALVSSVMNALPTQGKFADLFSGCGTFSGPLLDRGSVDAFESGALAVKALSKLSSEVPLRVYRRDLFKNPVRYQDLNSFDAIVFDPPRAGCVEQAHEMALSNCKTLVGVSCNPATFARDAKILSKGKYQLKSLQVIDQFLWSHHVEVVGVFIKTR